LQIVAIAVRGIGFCHGKTSSRIREGGPGRGPPPLYLDGPASLCIPGGPYILRSGAYEGRGNAS
jgi:hypothetical protein